MSATKAGSQERRKPKPEDFVFGKMIGEGSFSCVFLARDAVANVAGDFREYAIKVCEKTKIIRESKLEYIHREKDILATITQHFNKKCPFFVVLYSTFQDSLNFYFVMTYARNGDLLKFIDKMAERDIDCVQFYAAELLSAVEFLHFKVGVIHRDLKPENILLNEHMHILITDFGSAKFLKDKYNINNNRNSPKVTPANDDSDSGEEEVVETAEAGTSTTGDSLPSRPSKRRSFVGTAQYVSPEILRGRGSYRASDLWAIGCIIYQMITGLPPFQSNSEWLIFKKIDKLDYSFQEGFNEEAKDLIQKLLVIEPLSRLGATDKQFYASLKDHSFFRGVNFDGLLDSTPPALTELPELIESGSPDPCWAKDPDAKPGASRLPMLMLSDAGCGSSDGSDLSCSPVGIKYLGSPMSDSHPSGKSQAASGKSPATSSRQILSADEIRARWTKNHVLQSQNLSDSERLILMTEQKSNKYHRFVEGNLIIREGILDKKKGLLARRRKFLLTEGPRLYYVDPDRMVLKGQVPLGSFVKMEIRNPRIFFLHTPGRIYNLFDPKSNAQEWCVAMEDVTERYFGKTAN